jgi:putative oxidoreductase
VGAIGIIVVMLGAIFLVHWKHGFDVSKGGIEFALTQLLIAIALLLTGAGRYSLAGWLPVSLQNL